MTEWLFVLNLYGSLLVLLIALWGWGWGLWRGVLRLPQALAGLQVGLCASAGMGVAVLALQVLAVNGWLSPGPVSALLLMGLGLAGWGLVQTWRQSGMPRWQRPPDLAASALRLGLVLAALYPTWLAPLTAPTAFDELLYHLPHAREWAQSGQLSVNTWLRYPWFPYNVELLFAAALQMQGELMVHLVHALAGWLCTWLVYQLGLRYASPWTACLASVFWLQLSAPWFGTAYIDLALTLFVLSASVATLLWLETQARGWLLLACAMLGLAVGSKYQALGYLPLFVAVWAWRERRPSRIAQGALAFALPCGYWYLRNALLTGDPVTPLGGPWFGFHDWNAWDYEAQFKDLKRVANWPHPLLWPALAALAWPALWRAQAGRWALGLGVYATLLWWATSHYDRYLMPVFPVLALLSASVLVQGWAWLVRRWPQALTAAGPPPPARRAAVGLLGLGVLGLMVASARRRGQRYSPYIAFSTGGPEGYLAERVPAYALLRRLHQRPGLRMYQFALEGSLYYAPPHTRGEIFGPWRNHDYYGLPAAELAQRLHQQGFNTVLMRRDVAESFGRDPAFSRFFELLDQDKDAQAFSLGPPP